MNVLFGLGNPGSEYADTRHNVGWMVLDRILSADAPADVVHEPTMWARIRSFFSAHGPRGPWEKADGPYIQAQCSGDAGTREPFLLAKPLTYMNNSGEAARALADEYDLESSNILVIVDDVHLPLGEMRLRQKGSTGGHNGLASLHECLGTDAYPRLRIGVGGPPKGTDIVEFVLAPFADDEWAIIEDVIRHAADISKAFGQGGYALAATAYSRWRDRPVDDGTGQ